MFFRCQSSGQIITWTWVFLILSTNLIDTGCYCSNLPKHGASHTIFARRHDPALRGLLLAMRDEGHLAWGQWWVDPWKTGMLLLMVQKSG